MKENEIDKTLGSLDNLQRAKAPKDFSEQLFHKMKFVQMTIDPWYARLKYGVAAMITLAVLNGFILFQSDLLVSPEESTIETLADEWYSESDLIEYNYEVE